MAQEDDLPDYEAFQAVRDTPVFHRRRRFEMRLQARASKTIRKYGFFREDEWSPEDASRAELMLKRLRDEREMQRPRAKQAGRRAYLNPRRRRGPERPDDDAYLWEGVPDYAAFLDNAAKEVGAWSADPVAEVAACRVVKDRLLTDLHLPAVQEALGALIPEWLHPSQDDPKKRGKKTRFGGERIGVDLCASCC